MARSRRMNCCGFVVGLALAWIGSATGAFAVDENIIQNCMDDYFSYCSAHAPDTPELNNCMQSNYKKLSKQCTKALNDSGVPQKHMSSAAASTKK